MPSRIEITQTAFQSIRQISDRRTRSEITRRIDALSNEPGSQGSVLRGELAGLMSVRAAGQRYRVLFRIDGDEERVVILLVGIRREGSRQDIYSLARRLVERGLI